MALFYHRAVDFLSDDPFEHVEVLQYPSAASAEHVGSAEIDDDILATPYQTQIVSMEQAQWCKVRIVLPTNPRPTIERIKATWRQIAYHQEAPGTGYYVSLHVRRALVDSTSLGVIKVNFDLLYCGIPLQEHTPFRAYARFLAQVKNVDDSNAFWAGVLKNATPRNAVRPVEAAEGQLEFTKRSAISAELNDSLLYNLSTVELEYGISRRVLFETLWALVLQHHTGSDEVIFGSIGRDMSFFGAESCIGCLDQTYPVRLSVSWDVKFQDLADAVQAYHQMASQHSYVGYHEIQRHLHGVPVETVINYTPNLNSPSTAGQLTCFPLALSINGTRPLKLTLCHAPSIEAGEAEVLLSHFIEALRNALNKIYLPHALVGSIEIDSPAERTAIVKENRSQREERSSTITKLFEDAVLEHPDRNAVEDESGNTLTFAELNNLANGVARSLQLKKGDIVPVCMDRSIDLIVSLLAVLKSGAAYTILDPEGPKDRNLQIVTDCRASLVLTHRKYSVLFENSREIEHSLEAAKATNSSNLDLALSPQDNCYIVYTSGSAGKPKGVVLTHGAATNGMAHHSLNGKQRWLLFYNPTFSAAQRTMLSTLVHGGTLIVVQKRTLETSLAHILNDLHVDALGITPSALSLLHPDDVPQLKQVTLVGERIPQALVAQWAAHVELRNTYGLSECTQLNFGTRLSSDSNPRVIGRPADTTSAFVLVPGSTALAPRGVIGELCLAGPQLGSGYLNEFERTARAFVDNPFGKGKLYRTGDAAKMHHDGAFEIFGRIDFQAKINGQKVEPAEVDRVLAAHEAVAASITAAADIADRTVLVAGLVLEEGSDWRESLRAVRAHAERFLPAYMVPSFWVPLAEIPTNTNGKTDVRGFRAKAESLGVEGLLALMSAGADVGALADETELAIAKVWAKVLGLGLNSIGREHSFLMLGGSSIQAIRAIAELRKAGFEADMASLLSDATLEEAASTYTRLPDDLVEDPEPLDLIADAKIKEALRAEVGVEDAYPATPLQSDMLPSLTMDEDRHSYQRVWEVSGLDIGKLRKSFQAVLERREILRTSFVPNGRSIIQVVRNDMSLPWIETGLSLDQYLKHDRANRFSMDGPLFRLAVLSNSILVVTMHHSLFDFWSHRFLYQDVAAAYLGREIPLRAPFKRFVGYLAKQDTTAHRRWWREYLKGAEPTLLNHSPVNELQKLHKTLPGSLQGHTRKLGFTTGAGMYAAWSLVLSKHLNSQDVTFMSSLSGRDLPVSGVDSLDGPTLTIVPQRILLDPEQTLGELAMTFGMRNAFAAAKMPQDSVDTFLNILVSPKDDDATASVFKRYGPRPQWGLHWVTMEVEEGSSETAFRISGPMEERRLQYLMESFIETLFAILEKPSQSVAGTSVLSKAEADFLNHTLSNRESLYVPEPELLHARFEQHAAEAPNAIAIDWNGEEQVSYSALNARANQLAHHLVAQGTQIGDRIPLLLDKSVDTVVALLAVMKAGAAYVPLSPENPVERNLFITNDVSAKILIAHRAHASAINNTPHNLSAIVILDDIRTHLSTLPTTTPSLSIPPTSLAYLIYTSGSTGQPKGVQLPHRAAAAAVRSMEVAEGRNTGEWRTLQFANYVFDASVQDFFNTLSTGGTLCMASTERLLSDLAGAINAMDARQAILTPTVAKLLRPEEVPGFETLIVGGEPLSADVVSAWKGAGRTVLNVYGPTETSMVVTTKDLYRTGDLARWLPGGEIECLGRKDNQIKIHGHRIELGEVEAAVLRTGIVQNGAVILATINNKPQLVAFCIFESTGAVEIQPAADHVDNFRDFRDKLTGLTPYMVPKFVLPMGEFPKLPSRKIDRKTLKRIAEEMDPLVVSHYALSGPGEQHKIVPVQTEQEALLESMWAEIFQLPAAEIGREANFLALGGDSVSAISLSSMARKAGYILSVNNILRFSELAEMAAKLQASVVDESRPKREFVVPEVAKDAVKSAGLSMEEDVEYIYPCPPGQAEFVSQGHREEQMWALMAVRRMPPTTDPQKWLDATKRLAEINDILRTSWLQVADSDWVGVVLKSTHLDVTFAEVSNDAQANEIIEAFWNERFAFGRPFIKYAILRYPDQSFDLAIKLNHAVYDGTLLRIFDDHFTAILSNSPTIPAHVPFKDFALHIYQSDKATSLAYWASAFARTPATTPYPPLPSPTHVPKITASVRLPITTSLDRLARSSGVTPAIIFQAAFQLWLARASSTGTSVVSFDYLLSGRNVSDLPAAWGDPQTINGTVANFLPVRATVEGGESLRAYLQRTQDAFWSITEHGNVGLDEIYGAAGLERKEVGNRALFLFQPFEPAAQGAGDDGRWLVMAKSRVRMFQPYGLVVEVAKALGDAHRLVVMYDEGIFTEERATGIAAEISELVEIFAEQGEDGERLLMEL
ncbi:hypothetical protein B0J12DRAFT_768952 [Macrophomina phaseolina]|uniref:Carrier domain-containing protein n=1 Tax=Macrophomina phaseolina TaxID=35725 RepID=A0ABQ8FV37_9PEZI|nr:hypothetical protein B0J12DRAFT_768952 [Macrophomina phaseolina]